MTAQIKSPVRSAEPFHDTTPDGVACSRRDARDTVWWLVRAHAHATPQAAAIAAPGRMTSCFSALDRQIDALGAAFYDLGIRRESRVAVLLPNGPEMASACLAIASCATCAPLNPEMSAGQIEFLLGDLKARALVLQHGCHAPARAIADGLGIQVIDIVFDPRSAAGLFTLSGFDAGRAQSAALADADDVALILYTSGTTARPKQVPLTHANLCAAAHQVASSLALSARDRCLNILPLFHVHGLVAAVLASLSVGASVACTPGLAHGDFFAWLDELRPSWFTAVPTMHQAILTAAPAHRAAIERAPLRFIRSASAALPVRVARGLERWFDATVIEAYGMTEAAHQIASNPLPPAVRKPKSVGRAIGTEAAIMDDRGRLLARGETGEIAIRGPNVMRGYANDDAENAGAFMAGWLRTGDLGYIDADGYIFLTGRRKEIVVRGAEKLSLREIDDALLDHPSIARAVAFSVPHSTLGEDVAAAVVLAPGAVASTEEIRAFLLGRLAPFKVPRQIVLVDEIPAGATGKTERSTLHLVLAELLKAKYVAPRNEVEAQLAAIFTEVIRGTPIGINDNFFALGGDSLQGFRVLARIRATLRVSLSIVELFQAPTIAQLAQIVSRRGSRADALALEQILREVEQAGDDCGRSSHGARKQ